MSRTADGTPLTCVISTFPADIPVTMKAAFSLGAGSRKTSGRTFDSSLGKDPLRFRLGARRVIRGWDQGLLGMKVGGKRRLIIPPRLGYGGKTVGIITPGSWLIFEVELLAIEP